METVLLGAFVETMNDVARVSPGRFRNKTKRKKLSFLIEFFRYISDYYWAISLKSRSHRSGVAAPPHLAKGPTAIPLLRPWCCTAAAFLAALGTRPFAYTLRAPDGRSGNRIRVTGVEDNGPG
jgi:hypothetical protein